jgi:hypothetical protein
MRRLIEAIGALALLVNVAAAANYNEGVNGDLSDNLASPTTWILEGGNNSISGSAGVGDVRSDYDLVTFTVPVGMQIDSVRLDSYANQGYASFLGLQATSAWTTGFDFGVDGDTLLGWVLFDNSYVGTNMLPQMGANGAGYASGGFTPPLGAGTYTMLLQDYATPFSYGLTFAVSAVPEPATLSLAAVGLLGVWSQRRRLK